MAAFNKNKTTSTASASKKVPAAVKAIVRPTPDAINRAGGQAFRLTPHYEFAFLLLTSFLDSEFYRTPTQTIQQIRAAMLKTQDPLFCAKAAVYARTVYAMRSVSHLVAADIAFSVKGQQWTKEFFDKVVYRVDDASEILAAYLTLYKDKPIPNSLKKGLAKGLGKFNAYQLAKYKGNNKGVKLVDLFNLVHPRPNAEQASAFKALIEGDLASEGTWEAELSAAGQADGDKAANKAGVWKDLITTRKIGYFALLRNLRNILEQADEATIKAACELLCDKKLIDKSLVLPFRYMTAQAELSKLTSDSKTRNVMQAVNKAVELALSNVPQFNGETLVVLDDSASMFGAGWKLDISNTKAPATIGSLFAAVLAKRNNADLMLFNDTARYVKYNAMDSLTTVTDTLRNAFTSGGTDFKSIFKTANKKYDRIIIMSDMQGWVGHYSPQAEFAAYAAKYKATPKIYSFDLAGLGTVQFPQDGVFCLAGFSEKTMDLMKILEEDPGGLIREINAVEL